MVKGQRDIWTISADGGEPVPVTADVATDWDPIWSPNGRWLYFISDRGGSPDLWRVRIDEASGRVEGELQPVTTGIANVMEASISNDGRHIAVTAALNTSCATNSYCSRSSVGMPPIMISSTPTSTISPIRSMT